jgi:uncharacterized protein YrzB (UPF0473 family)
MTNNENGTPMPQDEPEIIFITNEDGEEEEFEVLMRFEVEDTGKNYMMVVPIEGDPNVDEVYAFRYEENEELQLFLIEDEEEWAIVEETFNTLMDEIEFEEQS